MIQSSTIRAHKYELLSQVLAWHSNSFGAVAYQLDRGLWQSSAHGARVPTNAFISAFIEKILDFDCPVSPDGLAYLQSMPNPAWIWKALQLVLSYRDGDNFARPISLFELQYAVWAYGMAGHEDYDLSLPHDELSAGQVGRLLLEGFLLMSEQDGEPVVVSNPIFIRPADLN